MIEIIEMHLPNYEIQISNNDALINGKKIKLNDDDIKNIIRIIRMWKPSYNNGVEKEKYYIYLKTNKEESKISFISSFPDDFYHLTDFLGVLYASK